MRGALLGRRFTTYIVDDAEGIQEQVDEPPGFVRIENFVEIHEGVAEFLALVDLD